MQAMTKKSLFVLIPKKVIKAITKEFSMSNPLQNEDIAVVETVTLWSLTSYLSAYTFSDYLQVYEGDKEKVLRVLQAETHAYLRELNQK